MRRKIAFKFIGKVLVGFSILFLFPSIIAIIYRSSLIPFIIPQAISLIIGLLLNRIKVEEKNFFAKDGFFIVSLSWILISIIGCLPFVINGDCKFIDALFETVSGFTTTGATIFKNVEVLDKSILFWRSFSHFIGGMGVLAFVMTIIPLASNDKSMHLLKAEMPGPKVAKLVPNMRTTLLYLYLIYIGLTFIEFILLLIGGMNVLDSLLISFGTAGTGGFSVLNNSLASYSVFSKVVVALFMFLFGVNFNVYYLILIKNFKSAFKSEELRVYALLYFLAVILVIINTLPLIGNIGETILQAVFHVSSFMTSTGYSIGDVNIYPTNCRVVVLLLMLISACAGSTCGGFKISRLVICVKCIIRDLRKIIYPNRVEAIKFEGQIVSEEVVKSTNVFLFLYAILIILIMFVVSFDGYSLETTMNAVFTTFANVGLSFKINNFSMFSDLSKIVMSLGMLLGRLEIFPLISLFIDFKGK